MLRPTPFPWFGNQVLQVSAKVNCTYIYSASKVLFFRRFVREPVLHRSLSSRAEKWCRNFRRSDPENLHLTTSTLFDRRSHSR